MHQVEYVHIHCLILIEGLQIWDSQIRRDLNENSNPVVITTLEGLPFLFTEKPKYIFHELESLIYFAWTYFNDVCFQLSLALLLLQYWTDVLIVIIVSWLSRKLPKKRLIKSQFNLWRGIGDAFYDVFHIELIHVCPKILKAT